MTGFIHSRTKELHWRLKVLENCLIRAGRIDVCRDFVLSTADSVLGTLNWYRIRPGLRFWQTLWGQLYRGDTPDFALVRAARRATERLLKEAA